MTPSQICTPRLKERALDKTTNSLQYELKAALEKQKSDHKFIIPLIFEGDRLTAIAELEGIQNILNSTMYFFIIVI